MDNCEGTACDDVANAEKFLSLTDLRTGMTLTQDRVDVAVRRLLATGFFTHIDVGCDRSDDGAVTVVLTVHGTWVVEEVEVEGNEQLLESDIRKRIFIRRGSMLDPRPEEHQDVL